MGPAAVTAGRPARTYRTLGLRAGWLGPDFLQGDRASPAVRGMPKVPVFTLSEGNLAFTAVQGIRILAPSHHSAGLGPHIVRPAAAGPRLRQRWPLSYRQRSERRSELGGTPPVLDACGYGVFMLTATELTTAVMHGLPVIVLVQDDQGFRSFGYHQARNYGGWLIGTDLVTSSRVAFARPFGVNAECVEDIAGLPAGVRRAVATPGPAVIQITDWQGRPWV